MRINQVFSLREMAGETIIVNQGQPGADLTRIISLNKSARLLYERLADKEFTVEDAARILCDTYGIEMSVAMHDAEAWTGVMKQCKIIE